MGIENIKYCKKCREAFGIATNFDICPKCRKIKREEENGDNS